MSELVDVTGVDFASELMLNKMMNGQVAASNGNTITAGLRSQASSLYRDSIEPSIASANVSAAIPDVTEVQTAMTEAKAYIESLYDNIITGSYETLSSTIAEGEAWLTEFLATTYGADDETIGTATTVDMGLGSSYDIGGVSTTAIAALSAALATLDETTLSAWQDGELDGTTSVFNDAIDEAIDGITVTSMQINTLQNRSLMLEEVASTYSTAGDSQILTGAGSTSGLLSNLIS